MSCEKCGNQQPKMRFYLIWHVYIYIYTSGIAELFDVPQNDILSATGAYTQISANLTGQMMLKE